MQERIERNERSVASRQGNPKELPEKVDKLVKGLDRLQENIGHGATFMDTEMPEMVGDAKNMIAIISNSMMN